MSLKKEIDIEQGICKVTFSVPTEIAKKFKSINVVGDFNYWDIKVNPMKETAEDGSKFISLELPLNYEYEFRYLCDGKVWMNEPDADEFVPVAFSKSFNSLITL
jgi:1,4-alpha-glucan branching enzyme